MGRAFLDLKNRKNLSVTNGKGTAQHIVYDGAGIDSQGGEDRGMNIGRAAGT